MYIEQDPVPVLEAQRFSRPMQRWQPQGVQYAGLGAMFNRPSMRMMRPRGAIGPTWLLAGLGQSMISMPSTGVMTRNGGGMTRNGGGMSYTVLDEGGYYNPFDGFGAAVNPLTLSLPGGGLTDAQKKICAAAKSRLANLPWVASPECGICPPPSPVSCPDCPAPTDCPAPEDMGYVLKTEAAAGGLAWWWILVAAAGGLVVGATAGYYSAKKPGPKVI